jgi:hypothetical protein
VAARGWRSMATRSATSASSRRPPDRHADAQPLPQPIQRLCATQPARGDDLDLTAPGGGRRFPLGALASCHPAQLAYVQERCRRYGDGMEILVLAVFVRPATPPVQNLASAGMCRHCLALDGAYGRIAAAGLRAELLECCLARKVVGLWRAATEGNGSHGRIREILPENSRHPGEPLPSPYHRV